MNTVTRSLAGLTGIALAAGLAYLFDPDNGKQRRSRLGSQCRKAASRLNEQSHSARNELSHRYHDASARAFSWLDARKSPDRTLARRVRTELSRAVPHPAAIGVIAHGHEIILHGDVIAAEHDQVLRVVRGVQGVETVSDHLAEISSPRAEKLGERIRHGFVRTRDDLAQPHWSPPARVGTGAVGLALIRWGARHRNLYGGVGALAGGALLLRSVFNTPLRGIGKRLRKDAGAAIEEADSAVERSVRDGNSRGAFAPESRDRTAHAAYGS